MSILKTLPKRIPTNEEGIFYKSIINENNKEIDKSLFLCHKEFWISLNIDFKSDKSKFTSPFKAFFSIFFKIKFTN